MATGGRNIPIPKPLSLTGNVGQNWKTFKRDFTNYEVATKLNKENMEIRVATLLSCIGSNAMDIYDGFPMSEEQRKQIPDILRAFENYCIGETNETYERYVFNSRNQQEGESVEKYIAELRRLAKSCNFDTLEDNLIRDRVVMGVRCDITRRKLLQEGKLTLQKATTIARAMEVTKGQMTRIKKGGEGTEELVHKVHKNVSQKKNPEENCHFCGKAHIFKKELCPAYGKTCNACKGKNHFAGTKFCRADIRVVTDYDHDQSDALEDEDDIWLSAIGNGRPRATATLNVNGKDIQFQLDTGSDVNTICQRYVRKQQVKRTSQRLTMWNKTKVEPIGEVSLETMNPKTGTSHEITYTVVPNSLSCLLGMETVKTLGFITLNETKYIAKIDENSALGDPESNSSGQDDRISQNGAKIDTFMNIITTMQKEMREIKNKMTTVVENTSQKEGVDVEKSNSQTVQMQTHVSKTLNDQHEKEEKKNNVIVYNVPEATQSDDKTEMRDDLKIVKEIISVVHPNVDNVTLCDKNVMRLGRRVTGKTRPIKIQFKDDFSKGKVFRNSVKLRSHEKYKNINISNDKTKKELMADKILKDKLEAEKLARPGEDLIIYRGTIMPRKDRPAKI